MSLHPLLLEVLACPQDHGSLLYVADEDVLYNPRLRAAYPIREGIAVLLVDEVTKVTDADHDRYVQSGVSSGKTK
jgi:uncharacterized protein